MSRIRIRLPQGEWFFDDARRLGRAGGFGEVFEGEDALGNPVAVKRLKITAAEAAHRELAIAKELARRTFTHVIAPLDSGQDVDSGGYFVVMPRAERSLGDELATRGPLPSAEAVEVLRQIVAGLQETPDIVHRDLKPANVLLHEDRWKIADFGIARFVEDATSLNTLRECLTPAYAAPEQWNVERATAATDVYALACIAHVLFSGAPPFPGPTPADYRQQHLSANPPPLTAAEPRLRALMAAALRKPVSGRPTLQRIGTVLKEIAEAPGGPAPVLAELQAVNAAEAERVSRNASEFARLVKAHNDREALVQTGEAILRGVFQELEQVARHNAPESQIHNEPRVLLVKIGPKATLGAEFDGAVPPNATFPNSKWEPVAIGRIAVHQGGRLRPHLRHGGSSDEWQHGATLWYMRMPGADGYRWYEVAYKHYGLHRGPLVGPFAIQDLGDDIYGHADAAAGPGMHTIEVESGPTPIDDEAVAAFIERWLSRLTLAYNGRLRPF